MQVVVGLFLICSKVKAVFSYTFQNGRLKNNLSQNVKNVVSNEIQLNYDIKFNLVRIR